mgnify:CR=1 FL=1
MGIFKGTATVSRYKVDGPPPPDFLEFVDRRIRANCFVPIDDATEQMRTGWCSAHDFLDTRFAYASYALDPFIVLGLRVDTRKLPTAVVRRELSLEIRRANEDQGRVLSRHDREELKEKIALDLLRRIPPTTHVYEVVWDTAKGEVLIGTDSRTARDLCADHFKRSFDPLYLVPQVPYLLATALLPQYAAALDALRPASLYRGEVA